MSADVLNELKGSRALPNASDAAPGVPARTFDAADVDIPVAFAIVVTVTPRNPGSTSRRYHSRSNVWSTCGDSDKPLAPSSRSGPSLTLRGLIWLAPRLASTSTPVTRHDDPRYSADCSRGSRRCHQQRSARARQ